MGSLAVRHHARPGWWRRFFRPLGEGSNRSGWIPWGWDAGIYPESMAGPYWPSMYGVRKTHRRPPSAHKSHGHQHHHHGGAAA